MTNFTLQYTLNAGVKIISQDLIAVDASGVTVIPAVTDTHIIRLSQVGNTRKGYVGPSTMTAGGADGFPLFTLNEYWDGAAAVETIIPMPVEYYTSAPDEYYLTGSAGMNILVQYLGIIT